MKKTIIIILLLVLVLFGFGCQKPITLDLSEKEIEITVGDTYEIKPIVQNLENPVYDITCESDIIKIENNLITALVAGECEVKVAIKDNAEVPSVSLKVTVKNIIPNKIISDDSFSLLVGETKQIEYSFEPSNAISDVKFSSANESIAKVSKDGLITTVGAGKTVISITLDVEGSTVKKEIALEVRGTELPTFTATDEYTKDVFVNWGTEIDYLKGLTATDIEDGDITNNIKVTKKIDSQEYGKQTIEYKVSDKDGNEATFTKEVEVVWNYDVQFIGHQGSYYGVPNTEEAILNGITKLKYQCIEIDIKQTKDGVFVLSHDDTFGGVTIASTNWNELKDVVATSTRKAGLPFQNGDAVEGATGTYSSTICTLARYLEICKQYNVKAVIELKSSKGISNSDQSRMPALMKVIEEADMLENVIFLGSAYNCLIWTRNNGYEYIPCQYLVSSIESETYLQRCIDYNLDISTNTTYGGSNGEEWIARYKEAGIKISTYTYTQYVDYPQVQEWIDKGVDFLTCDWQLMNKLKLPVSSNEPKQKFNVKFVDYDGTVLKERQVEQGNTAAAPKTPERKGYDFKGWDNELKNIQSDMVFTAQYEPTQYSISYMANLDVITESKWDSKEAFAEEFYNDLFEWIKLKGTEIDGMTVNGNEYTFKKNGQTVKFTSAADIKAVDIYVFEKTFSNILYKPVTRDADGKCVIYEDNNYFLNSSQYRIKYQALDQWLYNARNAGYSGYKIDFAPLSDGRIQIFFRMHQWMKGTSIAAFNTLPVKYIVEPDTTVKPVVPTSPLSYTILDEITLPVATGNAKFLGWYDNAECTGEAITKIEKGTTGNLVLYAKWEK